MVRIGKYIIERKRGALKEVREKIARGRERKREITESVAEERQRLAKSLAIRKERIRADNKLQAFKRRTNARKQFLPAVVRKLSSSARSRRPKFSKSDVIGKRKKKRKKSRRVSHNGSNGNDNDRDDFGSLDFRF